MSNNDLFLSELNKYFRITQLGERGWKLITKTTNEDVISGEADEEHKECVITYNPDNVSDDTSISDVQALAFKAMILFDMDLFDVDSGNQNYEENSPMDLFVRGIVFLIFPKGRA